MAQVSCAMVRGVEWVDLPQTTVQPLVVSQLVH